MAAAEYLAATAGQILININAAKSKWPKTTAKVAMQNKDTHDLRTRVVDAFGQGAMSTIVALLAYLPNQALGSKEGFWGVITAIAVVQSEFKATAKIARNQLMGAAIGGAVALCVVLGLGQHLWTYALAVALSVFICGAANVGSASRLAGITATIVLLVPHTGSVQAMLVSRLSEVAWGICVAIATVWLADRMSCVFRAGARPVP